MLFVIDIIDINECGNGYNDCHLNATCTNVPGSYHCQCKKGFVGSGKLCEGKDTVKHRREKLTAYAPPFSIRYKFHIHRCY